MEVEFSDWLNKRMEERGINQNELAQLSRITPPQVSRILSGQRGAGNDALRGIANALYLPAEVVFRAAGELPPVPPNTERQVQLIHLFSLLSEEKQLQLLELARFFITSSAK